MLSLCVVPAAQAATDVGTLTKGSAYGCPAYFGYHAVGPVGSYSPTGLTGGKTVFSILDNLFFGASCPGGVVALITVTSFSSDPGSAWLTSVTCNGVTKTGASASFSYSGGAATWMWASSWFGFSSLANGTNVSCTIVHN